MKNITMKTRLAILCGFFLAVFLFVNVYNYIQTSYIVNSLDNIGGIQLVALRKISVTDMYHEELEAVVYGALYGVSNGDGELLKEMVEDYEKASKIMRESLDAVDKLGLHEKTKEEIKITRPAVESYIAAAYDIVQLASAGKKNEAVLKLKDFNIAFKAMEVKLEHLSSMIEKDAMESQLKGREIAHLGKKVSAFISIFSLLLGLAASWYIVNTLMSNILVTTEVLSQSVHDVQNSSQKMNLVSRRLASSVDRQVSSIAKSVAAMGEISHMIKTNNESADNAAHLSSVTKSSAESGKATVDKMMHEMQEISTNYDEIQNSIIKNSEDIKKIIVVISQIAQKTELVNDIVFQSKLLSFNASIEAARAGESGKGFAVVAEEVGNLAQMSGQVASDITKMLKESQDHVNAISEMTTKNMTSILNRGREKVQQGSTVAAECIEDLDKIISSINDLDSSISEILIAIREQNEAVAKVNDSLKLLDDATHESTDMSVRTKNASDKLRIQSYALRSTIQELRKILSSKKSYDVPPLDKIIQEESV